ncbi:MAG TPA: flagellin [Acidimicrobiales bacterium]|nr:flagellin [Acidimicrobiales bacterium]
MTDMSGVFGGAIVYTPQIIADQLVSNIVGDQSQQATLEQQIATGSRINQPSDDPAGTASVMQLQAANTRAQQYVSNANDGLGWLSLANSTLNQVVGILQTVHSTILGVTSAGLTGSQAGLSSMATSVQGALQSLLNLANTQYGGQAIFAGTGNVQAAYDASGNYIGGGSAPTRAVAPGTSVAVSVAGPDVFGSGATGLLGNSSGNTGVLAQIAQDLQAGTPASLQKVATTDLDALNNAINQVETQAAVVGTNYQQMQTFSQEATNAQAALAKELSGIQSTNMPQAISDLTQAQTSYQSALWATAQIRQNSLVQFLG